jgi:DNA replication protein DnaC
MARLHYRKTLESFDDGFQPSVDRTTLQDLATGRFLAHDENIVFLGPSGTGNTHMAIGRGLKAVQQGHRMLFTSVLSLITTLMKAYADHRVEDRLKLDAVPKLLMIDEIGYSPSIGTAPSCSSSSARAALRRGPSS